MGQNLGENIINSKSKLLLEFKLKASTSLNENRVLVVEKIQTNLLVYNF